MSDITKQAKTALREQMRQALDRITPTVRQVESMDLCARLEPQLQSAHTILFYAPLADELDVWPLLEKFAAARKICALPAFNPASQTYTARIVFNPAQDVATGKFGVREPALSCPSIELNQFDLVLVPGMAFDPQGYRLGRGRGFYDRILAVASGIKYGIGYDFQIQPNVPAEQHDMKVDFLFTPSRGLRRKK